MKFHIIVIAILSGWLFSEIKDFIVSGGFDNKLATILIRIIFIINGILICAFTDFNFQKYFNLLETKEDVLTPTPYPCPTMTNLLNNSRRSASKSRRTRFSDFTLSE